MGIQEDSDNDMDPDASAPLDESVILSESDDNSLMLDMLEASTGQSAITGIDISLSLNFSQ
jgi:hypothetical protein